MFILAPRGVFIALGVAAQAVRSYRRLFTLTCQNSETGGIFSVALSSELTFQSTHPVFQRARSLVESGSSSSAYDEAIARPPQLKDKT